MATILKVISPTDCHKLARLADWLDNYLLYDDFLRKGSIHLKNLKEIVEKLRQQKPEKKRG